MNSPSSTVVVRYPRRTKRDIVLSLLVAHLDALEDDEERLDVIQDYLSYFEPYHSSHWVELLREYEVETLAKLAEKRREALLTHVKDVREPQGRRRM